MSDEGESAAPLTSRFLLERFDDGGALLDLDSGRLFRLNRTAAEIWSGTLGGRSAESIARALSAEFGLPAQAARHDVHAAQTLPTDAASPSPPTELVYEAKPGGYLFSMGGRPAMELDVATESLRAFPGIAPGDYGICLRAIAPKLVARTGPLVLHASAVSSSFGPMKRVTAFLGISGAGKTTTAKTFAANGYQLLCEDKLVTETAKGRVAAVLEGEPRINRWIRETRQALEAQPDRPCGTAALAACSSGPSLPIEDVFLVDSRRRVSDAIELRQLPPSEAACEIFQHAFYGSGLSLDWRRQLGCVANLARTARVFVATMPDGLPELARAVRRYSETTAS